MNALQRARALLEERTRSRSQQADLDAIRERAVEDVTFTMPPLPARIDGREMVLRFMRERMFETSWRLEPRMAMPMDLAFDSQNAERLRAIYGSRTLWGDLLAHGLVDELHLMVGPKVVAGDHHAFAGVPQTDVRLLDVRRFDGSDNVLLSYAPR